MPSNEWTRRRLGTLLKRISLPVEVEPEREYRQIGIRSHGKGIFHKAAVSGESLGEKRVFWVEKGALTLNIVFAWEQAVAVTSDAEVGMIASHRFPMYLPSEEKCNVNFLLNFFKTKRGKDLLVLASPGGAGRNKTLGQAEFEKIEILLPGLKEQEKISAVLDAWEKAILVNERLVENTRKLKKAIVQKLLPSTKNKIPANYVEFKISDLVDVNPSRTRIETTDMVSFVPMDAVSEDGRITKKIERPYESVKSGYTFFEDGDVLIAKITPCFENGKGALVSGLRNGFGFGSTEFHVLRAKEEVSGRLIGHIVSSNQFRRRGESEMVGSAGQKRVSPEFIRSFKVAIPRDSEEQRVLVDTLNFYDELLSTSQAALRSLKEERAALAQRLLTGRVRMRGSDTNKEMSVE